ncbi:proline--tRNA ligase [Helicobacter cynogastricus]|uniref:proline--tRNA ligase n=1 Tax=Helicobacter cynogastricus TaxID=329937 RepID=UPI000CF06698|nr:proline--tRNA ligase [Helicobacter cynogastricus]
MRFSQLFAPTTKEVPKDALLKSHRYMLQGGYIQQMGSGLYHFLPLGHKVLNKIRAVVKEVMDSYGAQECTLGFVVPAFLWQESGRFEQYGKELLSFPDRKNNLCVLSPTHEEAITQIAKSHIKSYKQLPLNLYQIHTKFRDEIRPRFGLLRAREFVMKDAYSFHANTECLDKEFERMHAAYSEICTRLGLNFRAVEADSGAIGGSKSQEFVILTECGEDSVLVCQECRYAANVEIAKRAKRPEPEIVPKAQFAKFHTPDTPTIEALSSFFKVHPYFLMKALIKKARLSDRTRPVVFFLRGDDQLEETKALNAFNRIAPESALELGEMSAHEIGELGLPVGYIGAYGIKNIVPDMEVIFDIDLQEADCLICGANEVDQHFVGVDLSTFAGLNYQDIAQARPKDACPECGGALGEQRSIEVGHIFKLGNKYSKSLEARFLDQEGRLQYFEMGCYGIGVSRLMSAILEQNSDEKGCVWSKSSAPFEVVVLVANSKDSALESLGEELYKELKGAGVDALLDDRIDRFGAKMADFELIGCAHALIVGKQALEGQFELITRQGLHKRVIARENIVSTLLEARS